MTGKPETLNIRPRVLYEIAKAAWNGELIEKNEAICNMLHEEYKDHRTRAHIKNQIRIAMGLDPHEDEVILKEDEIVLMGMAQEPITIVDADLCKIHCKLDNRECEAVCPSGAISHDSEGKVAIDKDKCYKEGYCVESCYLGALAHKSQFVPLIEILKQKHNPVIATVAPAIAGQFGENVTLGQIRIALQKIGFSDMVETALAADFITIKEAFEFEHHVKNINDFMITSCCCPVWIKLIENKFPHLVGHISPSVSPMIASGRILKALYKDVKVVFIGPCVAKKTEITLPDVKGAIDFVLTFQELNAIFEAAGVKPADQDESESIQSASWGGRVYARTGGVSGAVETTLEALMPKKAQVFKPIQVDGVPACQNILNQLDTGKIDFNFIEGMACKGGCVGGPAKLKDTSIGTTCANKIAKEATCRTPVENASIYAILVKLGYLNQNENYIPDLADESPINKILARDLINKTK